MKIRMPSIGLSRARSFAQQLPVRAEVDAVKNFGCVFMPLVGAKDEGHPLDGDGAAEVDLVVQSRQPLELGKELRDRNPGGPVDDDADGAGAIWFITSTVESLKLGSGSPARAIRSIVVNGFALSAKVDHDIPQRTSNAQSALIMGDLVAGITGSIIGLAFAIRQLPAWGSPRVLSC